MAHDHQRRPDGLTHPVVQRDSDPERLGERQFAQPRLGVVAVKPGSTATSSRASTARARPKRLLARLAGSGEHTEVMKLSVWQRIR